MISRSGCHLVSPAGCGIQGTIGCIHSIGAFHRFLTQMHPQKSLLRNKELNVSPFTIPYRHIIRWFESRTVGMKGLHGPRTVCRTCARSPAFDGDYVHAFSFGRSAGLLCGQIDGKWRSRGSFLCRNSYTSTFCSSIVYVPVCESHFVRERTYGRNPRAVGIRAT